MNEVSTNHTVGGNASVAVTSLNKPEVDSTQVKASVSSNLERDSEPEQQVAAKLELEAAVAKMSDFIQAEQRDLSFSVDEDSGETVVKVIDRESGELVRQIPNQDVLDLAESLTKNDPVHLISVYG